MKIFYALKLTPLLSLFSLGIVAVFNIGYFSIIGIHFIGIIDISNLVYSFALVFPIVTALLQGLSGPFADFLRFANSENAWERYRKISLKVVFPIAIAAFAAFIFADIYWSWNKIDGMAALFMLVMSFNFSVTTQMYYKRTKIIDWSDIGWALATLLLAVSFLGSATARSQIRSQKNSFTIKLTDVLLLDTKIVRSSSNGFIVVVADRIMFIPHGEIKFIQANNDIQ